MLGDIVQLAQNLWYVEGEMPQDSNKDPDPANVLVYRAGERLYLMDSGVGHKMRASIPQPGNYSVRSRASQRAIGRDSPGAG